MLDGDIKFKPDQKQSAKIWHTALKMRIIGQTSPAKRNSGQPVYDCLVPLSLAVQEVNYALRKIMLPITEDIFKSICQKYRYGIEAEAGEVDWPLGHPNNPHSYKPGYSNGKEWRFEPFPGARIYGGKTRKKFS